MADIFICYRRRDSAGHAGRLVDDLSEHFPDSRIFHDLDSLRAGVPFDDAIDKALNSCVAFLAVIGPRWRDSIARLEEPRDYVRLEIETALKRDVLVIPVLVGGAPVPTRGELPDKIAELAGRQVHEITDKRWDYDVQALSDDLQALPGLSKKARNEGVRVRMRKWLAGRSGWRYVPLGLIALLLISMLLTRTLTGGRAPEPPSGALPLDIDLMQVGASGVNNVCIKPLDCVSQTAAGTRLQEDIRLRGADVYVDADQKQLHILLGVSWTLREGQTNILHRGYSGDLYYVAAYARDVSGNRVLVSNLKYRDDTLTAYNGLLAFAFGWLEIPGLRDRDSVLTAEISRRINAAPGTQNLQ